MAPIASTSSTSLVRRSSHTGQEYSSPHFNGGASNSKGKVRQVDYSLGGEGGAARAVEQTMSLVWEVNWRNVQTKKNKTWEG